MSNVFQESNATNQPEAPAPAFKKGLLGKHTGPKAAFGTMSPTDNFMSPISAKLSGAKQRHFQKGKPNLLASKLSSLASEEKKDSQ